MVDFKLPATMKNYTVPAALAALEMEKAGDGIEPTFGVLKYPAKNQFALRIGGRDFPFLRKDDGTPVGYVDVVFVRSGTTKAKTFYQGGYRAGSKDRPTCWSSDAVKPDMSVVQKVSDSCLTCPKNKVGSAVTDTGKPAKACSDHKRTAVMIDPNTVLQAGAGTLGAPVMLRIPASSLNNYSVYGDNLTAAGLKLICVVTRIKFDPDSKFQKFVFELQRGLTNEEAGVALELRESAVASQIIGAGENQLAEIEAGENERPATVYHIQGEGEPMRVERTAAREVIDLKPEPPKPTPEPEKPPVDPEEEELARMETEMALKKAAMAVRKANGAAAVASPAAVAPPRTRKAKEAAPPSVADDDGGIEVPDDLKEEISRLLG